MTQVVGYDVKWTHDGSNLWSKKQCPTGSECNPRNAQICPSGDAIGQKYYHAIGHDYADCLGLSKKSCDVGGVKSVKEQWNKATSVYQGGSNTDVPQDCIYNVDDFDTYEKVLAFYNKFIDNRQKKSYGEFDPKEAKKQFNKILVHFLSNYLTDKGCSSDPLTGAKRKGSCSYLSSSSEAGIQLRNWYINSLTAADRDEIAVNICTKYPGLPECACLQRSSDPIYKAIKPVTGTIDDCCWWIPCANPAKFFIPTKEQCVSGKKCPKVICQNVVEAIDKGKVTIKGGVKNYVNCTGDPSKPNKGGGSNGGNGVTFPEWEKVLLFTIPATIFVIALLVYEFPQAKEFIRVHHVAFGLGLLIISTISGLVFWYYNYGPGKKN